MLRVEKVKAELRLPWDFNNTRYAYRVETTGVRDYNNQFYNNPLCTAHDEPPGKIDFVLSLGENVRASEAGEVVNVNTSCNVGCEGWGNYIKLKHSVNSYTIYAHLSEVLKTSGTVKQGEVIGKVGQTGSASGPHIHYEWWTCNGTVCRTNPSFFEGKVQVFPNPDGRLVCGYYTSKNGEDKVPPEITIIKPAASSELPRKFTLEVNLKDIGAAGLKDVRFSLKDIYGNDYSAYLGADKIYTGVATEDTVVKTIELPNGLINLANLTLKVEANDNYNNHSERSVSFSLDGTDPEVSFSLVPPAYSSGNEIYLAWEMQDNFTPVSLIKVGYEISGAATETAQPQSGMTSFGIGGLSEGDYSLLMHFTDEYGNTVDKQFSFTIDRTPPSKVFSAVNSCGIASDVWQNSCRQTAFIWEVPFDNSGISGYKVYFGTDEEGEAETFVASAEYATETLTKSGSYYLRLSAVDMAGNHGPWNTVHILRLDITEPLVEFKLVPANGPASITKGMLAVHDVHSGAENFRYKVDTAAWSDWTEFIPSFEVALQNKLNVPQIVKLELKDKAGNISDVSAQSYTLQKQQDNFTSDSYMLRQEISALTGSSATSAQKLFSEIDEYAGPNQAAFTERAELEYVIEEQLPHNNLSGNIYVGGVSDGLNSELAYLSETEINSSSLILNKAFYQFGIDAQEPSFSGYFSALSNNGSLLFGEITPFHSP